MSPPPGYVGFGSSGAYGAHFKRVGGPTKATKILLWIYLPLQIVPLIDLARITRQADRLLAGAITEQAFKDATTAGAGAGVGLLVIPIAVLTMIWMYRMATNLRMLGRVGQTWAPGWGVASWFVPPCFIYAVPWLMFRELWKGSDPSCQAGDPTWKQRKPPRLFTVWWVMYGFVPIFSLSASAQLVGALRSGETTLQLAQRYHDLRPAALAGGVLGMAATAVYIQLVRRLSARHMQATGES
jgi:hypothetical protein